MNYLLKRLKNLPYHSSKNQERVVENILIDLGIEYVSQPNGTQKYPDFYLKSLGIDLECKSSNGNIPMWNCTYPRENALYVFCSKQENKTFVFLGSEIVTPEIKDIYEEYSRKHKSLQVEINEKLSKIDNKYNMKVFARNMFTQGISFKKILKEKELGQYFTTDPALLGSMLNDYNTLPKSILEPSSGVGNLISLLADKSIVDAIDIDGDALSNSRLTNPDANHILHDFLTYKTDKKYDLIIGNPPFFEIKKDDVPSWYGNYISGRTNIYYLFIYKCLCMLEEDGDFRFIIPRAFLSNKYASKLREHIAMNFDILDIVFFDNKRLFKNATQAVVIIKIKNRKPTSKKHIFIYNNNIIFVKDSSKIDMSNITINSLGCSVKTGSIVWNNHKEILYDTASSDRLELLYASSVSGKKETNKDKKRFLKITENNVKNIIDYECILVQRIVGDSLICRYIDKGKFFIENHVNIISGEPSMLKQIYKSLLSDKTSYFINQAMNNTQVSKNELENIVQIYI